jgi:N6-adenosine-specific RNA methylase IME4
LAAAHFNSGLRSAAEFWLIGTRGRPKPESRSERNLIVAPIREHSRKPDQAYEMLERMFPSQRRCELFARFSRPGWDQWGLEIEKFRSAARRSLIRRFGWHALLSNGL